MIAGVYQESMSVLAVKFALFCEGICSHIQQDIKTYNHYLYTAEQKIFLFSIHAIIHVPLKLEERTNSSGLKAILQ